MISLENVEKIALSFRENMIQYGQQYVNLYDELKNSPIRRRSCQNNEKER